MPSKRDARFQDPAFNDALTGLYNRYFLYQVVPQFIEKAEINNSIFGILMFDIDNFKNINDTHGHLVGDAMLKEVAKVLDECVRGEDLVIRYAGDEFLVFLNAKDKELSSFEIAGKRIVERIGKIVLKTEKAEVTLSASGGLALYPQDGKKLEELIDSSDKALYLSKDKGKNVLSLSKEVNQGIATQKAALQLFPCEKFINRSPQLQITQDILQETLTGKISLVLIRGKSGIGKTRFLDEFQKFVNSKEIFSLKINGCERHMIQPYYAISHALEYEFKKNEILLTALADSLTQEEIHALSSLMPVFKDFLKKDSLITGEEGISFFKALRSIFVELSSSHGLFLYFDDIQWLDKATFELLGYLINYEFVRIIMICGALNEQEAKEGSPLKDFLFSPKEKIKFAAIDLPPFSLAETQNLITAIFHQIELTQEFSQYIYEISEGSPLFIEELLKYLIESGIILYKDNRWQISGFKKENIPATLEEILQRRFRKLDPETKEMLAKAAVIGEGFDSEILRRSIKKDQGYLYELLDRVKKKAIFGTKEGEDGFDFLNPSLQKLFYAQINKPEKENLHLEVVKVLEELYADKPTEVLGDLHYQYEMLGNTGKALEFKDKIIKDSLDIFKPQQLESYLNTLSRDGVEVSIPPDMKIVRMDNEINKDVLLKVVELIKFIFAALKNIALYPRSNKIRESSLLNVQETLYDVLKGVSGITLREVDKILLVNNARLPSHVEREMLIENLIFSFIDKDIKGIQFLPEVTKDEVNLFLEIFSESSEKLRNGLIAQRLNEKGVKRIKLDVAYHEHVVKREMLHSLSERINKISLLNFLSGKSRLQDQGLSSLLKTIKNDPQSFSKILQDAVKSLLPQGGSSEEQKAKVISESIKKISEGLLKEKDPSSQESLRKLVSTFDNNIKSYLFSQQEVPFWKEMVRSFSVDEITEIILSAGKSTEKKDFLYNMRDLYNRLVSPLNKKEEISASLREKLKKIGLSQSEISFVTQKKYETLPLQERIETILKLPPEAYFSLGEDNIKDLLKELVDSVDRDNLQVLIRHLLSDLESKDHKSKEASLKLIGFFLALAPPNSPEFDLLIGDTISVLESVFLSAELSLFPALLHDMDLAIQWCYKGAFTPLTKERWIIRNRFAFLDKVLFSFYTIMEVKEESESIQSKKKLIMDLILTLLESEFIHALVLELKDPFLDYNEMIFKHIARFGKGCLRMVLNKVLEGQDFSSEGYLFRRKIAGFLKNMGEDAIKDVTDFLSLESSPQKLKQIIEIIGYMKEDVLVNSLASFLGHTNYEIKEALVVALKNIGSPSAKEVLLKLAKDTDPRISRLAQREIKA